MSLIETSKEIYELIKKGATLELQEKLIKMREEALALQEENIALKEQIKKLEERLAVSKNLEWDGRVYWLIVPDGKKQGPFCQYCYDTESKLIRLQAYSYTDEDRRHDSWGCLACKNRVSAN